MSAKFMSLQDAQLNSSRPWAPVVVKRAHIEAEIERLADEAAPENGFRSARIVHPQAGEGVLALAPDIDVTLNVLKPGESTPPIRHNSSQISLCIQGEGEARIAHKHIRFDRYDVWNTPGMHPYVYKNTGKDLQVRLVYSNAALLDQLRMHYIERGPATAFVSGSGSDPAPNAAAPKTLSAPIVLDAGAELLTYEHLISPEVVPNAALHWRWADIQRHRDEVFPLDALKNKGRRGLFVLYNPATRRLVGMTHNFFATIGFMPANVLDFPHRHSSNAINYALDGAFVSEVDGVRMDWEMGDIAYTAPSWSAHANGGRAGGTALTVQDHPFQIATECLVWQEGEGKPVRLLGAEAGFSSDDSIELAAAE